MGFGARGIELNSKWLPFLDRSAPCLLCLPLFERGGGGLGLKKNKKRVKKVVALNSRNGLEGRLSFCYFIKFTFVFCLVLVWSVWVGTWKARLGSARLGSEGEFK